MGGLPTGRRQFLGGLLAAGLIPKPTWADAGSPAYLSAAARPDGSYVLCGIGNDLDVLFQIALPARGHAAAAHPTRPEAVAFARRPGTFAVVIDCVSGTATATLDAPQGRHFYGHGVYSSDGQTLFTTENDYEAGRGIVGIWNVPAGYRRRGEFESGGIGPHDIKRLPDTDTLVVANGGIDTHPASGRTKLNIPTMKPSLAYIEGSAVVEQVFLSPELHKNSIRHLAVSPSGEVAFGMQWQGDGPVQALVGTHKRGKEMVLLSASEEHIRAMDGYIGSIAYSRRGETVAVTSPRGGLVQLYDTSDARLADTVAMRDVCGVAVHADGFTVTAGTGALMNLTAAHASGQVVAPLQWDNHLIAI